MPEPRLIVCIVREINLNAYSLVYELAQDQFRAPNIPRYKMDWPIELRLPDIGPSFEVEYMPNGS